MGLATVAVYSDCDRRSLHVRMADEACPVGPDLASESYLRIDKLIDVARLTGADAVHPGYGFLAENPEFAEGCANAGITFIGPESRAMRLMGSKTGARAIASNAGVRVVPGTAAPFSSDASDSELDAAARDVGYPLIVKAVEGGGGKGMRVVRTPQDLSGAVRLARSEALSAFGDDHVYFERLLDRPRHIEVQLLGDRHGRIVPFIERECSIQRRHQKLVEETPSPLVTPALRTRLMDAAAAIGRQSGYSSAGTVEFLVDGAGDFYFLEMNARLQVEHPITEAVTGVDFVRAQLEIAEGKSIEDVIPDVAPAGAQARGLSLGHAIEVRVYAENAEEGFLPSPGLITHLSAPSGPGIRDDSGAFEGWVVPTAYDALISKVVAWAPDRRGAIARMVRALSDYDVRGISTTIGFCRDLIASADFAAGEFDTTFVDRLIDRKRPPDRHPEGSEEIAAIAAALALKPRPAAFVSTTGSQWAQHARVESLR